MLTAWLLEAELRPMRPAECRAAVRIGALGRLREPMISAVCSTILLLEGFAWASRYYSTKGDDSGAFRVRRVHGITSSNELKPNGRGGGRGTSQSVVIER